MQYTHDQYEECSDKWRRARDVIAGEDAVKAAGVAYLPRLSAQNEEEYQAYKWRAKFVNATGRTLEALQGMVFRKEPELKVPTERQPLATEMAAIVGDADLKGSGSTSYSRTAVREVISVSRCGTLVDYDDKEKRPYFAFYKAEDIWHWRTDRVGVKSVLSMVALHECSKVMEPAEAGPPKPGDIPETNEQTVEKLLICKLSTVDPDAGAIYTIDVWEMLPDAQDPKKKKWQYVETRTPTRRKEPLKFIPFKFHSPHGSEPDCCKLPLEDLISVNLHHYRLSADYGHGLHFTALPTAWVAGFDPKTVIEIGSSRAWVTDKTDAKAGFLEYTGQGLGAIKDAIDDDKKDMAMLGARLIREHKREAETAEALKLQQSGESSVLTDIARSVSKSVTDALKFCYWWLSNEEVPEKVPDDVASIELNTDYVEARLDAADMNALVATWISQGISHKTLLENLRRGEILSKTRTDEEEMELIKETGPPVMPGSRNGNGGPP